MRPAVVPAAGEGGVGAMPEDRLTEYLDGIDTAAEWLPIDAMLAAFAPPAMTNGTPSAPPVGEYGDYLVDINRTE